MLKNTFYPTMFMTAALLVFALLVVTPALAVTFTVNSTLDQPDDLTIPGTCHTAANTCTLRAAVMQANRSSGLGATIIVPAGTYTLTIPEPAGSYGEENGDLKLTTPVSGNPVITIIGDGASTTIIDANQLNRVFFIEAGRTASITDVTIRNGYSPGLGGGIYIEGTLTVINSTISGNQAGYSGGGIFMYLKTATLTVTNSTISGNSALIDGGGILNEGMLTVSNSTISGNSALADGGGISNFNNLTVINSTLSQNNANNNGGGINNFIFSAANVFNTSIVFNGADADYDANGGSGGGVYNSPGAIFALRNTLLASNYVHNLPIPDDCKGVINSYGVNLFSDFTGCTVNTHVYSYSGYFSGSLGPLQDNGGPTWTHALLPDNNAIDGEDQVRGCIGPDGLPLATDQRGAPRVAGIFMLCDIGAFEYGAHAGQAIQFGPIANKTLADSPFVITATSSSDLAVDFSTNTPSICTVTSGALNAGVSSATVVLSRGGACTLVAQQAGNQIFDPAIAVTQTFNVTGGKIYLPLILS